MIALASSSSSTISSSSSSSYSLSRSPLFHLSFVAVCVFFAVLISCMHSLVFLLSFSVPLPSFAGWELMVIFIPLSPPFSSFLSVFDCLTFFPLLYNNLSIQSRVPAGWKLLVIILIPIFLSPFIFLFYSFRCLTHSYPRYLFLTHLSHPSYTFCPRLASFTRHPPPKRAVSHPSGSFQI